LYCPYNAIFGKGFANKFNMALHMGYLCMKMLTLHGIITIHNSQKEARNIEKAIYRSQRNINSVDIEPLDMPKGTTNLKDQEDTKMVPLEQAVPNRQVIIGANLSAREEVELIDTLAKNKDIFAWTASDLQGVSRDIIEYALDINPNTRPKKQR
jgi:activator of HSP90 ATPase